MTVPKIFLIGIFAVVLLMQLEEIPCQQLGLAHKGFLCFIRFLFHLLRHWRVICKSRAQYVVKPCVGPALIDWRRSKTYPSPRNQDKFGKCGCCWAFAPVSVLEILYSREHNRKIQLSVQQVMDCCPDTDGCESGRPNFALQYLVDVGVTWENVYPFTGAKGTCRSVFQIAVKVARYTRIENMHSAIVKALQHSPLVVNLHCPQDIQGYKTGVLASYFNDKESCNHAAVIVGHGEDYWIIRNSWGKRHGKSECCSDCTAEGLEIWHDGKFTGKGAGFRPYTSQRRCHGTAKETLKARKLYTKVDSWPLDYLARDGNFEGH